MLNREKMLRHLQLVMIILAFASLLEFFGGIFLIAYYNTLIGTSQQIGLILLEETTRKVLSLMVSSLTFYLAIHSTFVFLGIYSIMYRERIGPKLSFLSLLIISIGVGLQAIPILYIIEHTKEILQIFSRGLAFMARLGQIFVGTLWNMEELFPSAVILGDITGKFIIIIGVALALISMEKSLRGSSEAVDISNLNIILIVVLLINFLANFWPLLFYLTRLILFLVLIAYAYTLS